jgi:hypothetical protein
MYPIVFNKARAEELITMIGQGRNIAAPAAGWNCDEILQVAGALLFAATAHGPPAMDKSCFANVMSTNGESTAQSLNDDLHMAIDFYADLTMMVCGGSYDQRFQPELLAVVMRDGHDRGFKIISGGSPAEDDTSSK